MAEIVKNKKGFKVIKMRTVEMFNVWKYTTGICDRCNKATSIDGDMAGYYIAVLNQVFCQEDYENWNETATYYPEDSRVEEGNFNYVKTKLGL